MFHNGAKWLLTAAFAAAITQPAHVFVVGDVTTTGGRCWFTGLSTGKVWYVEQSSTNVVALNAGGAITGASTAQNAPCICDATINSASSSIRVNGVQVAASPPSAGTNVLDGITLGANFTHASLLLVGNIAAIAVIRPASGVPMLPETIAAVRRYLAREFLIAAATG